MEKIKKIPSAGEIRKGLSPLFKNKDLKLVILFGSAVSGKMHARSDIDIAFLFETPFDILSLTNRVISLLRTDSVDIVDLKRANPLLKYSIARNCEVLHEKAPGIFHEFYSLSFRMYVDTGKLRDARAESIRTFLRGRGMV